MIQQFEFDGEIYSEVDFNENITDCAQDNYLPGTTIKLGVTYELIGVTALPVVKTSVSGSNCNFTYCKVPGFDHVIHLIDDRGNKVMIKLIKSEAECYSGWTTATFVNIQMLNKGVPVTHRNRTVERVTWIREGVSYYLINHKGEEIVSVVISGDKYCPSDEYRINLDHFKLVSGQFNPKPTAYVVVDNSGNRT